MTPERIKPIVGIDRYTGIPISGWPRCRQAIETILTTRFLTRVMRPWFGSRFMDMIDKPGNAETFALGLGAAIDAIDRFEPEFRITIARIDEFDASGRCVITIEGVYLPEYIERREEFPFTFNLAP